MANPGILGVIIAYKNLEVSEAASKSALETCAVFDHDIEIVVHDNTDLNENIHVLWNRYLKQAVQNSCPYFMILNPDTKYERGWLEKMLKIFKKSGAMAAVGPSTNKCYNEQANRKPEVMALAEGSWVPNVLVPGFVTLFRTMSVAQVGGWREDFQFYGGDLDLVYRLQLQGFLSAWAVDAFVWHGWGGSAKALGDERYAELRRIGNVELERAFREYGGYPEGKRGKWYALPGGGVRYGEALSQESGEDSRGRESPREETHEETTGLFRAYQSR